MRSARRSSRRRGFTLIEMLAVVVVIGITALIGFTEYRKISRREALSVQATQISTLLQQAAVTVRQRDAITWVKIGPAYSSFHRGLPTPFRDIQLVVDTCCGAGLAVQGNGVFDDPAGPGASKDTVVQTVAIPLDDVSFSTTAAPPAIEETNWGTGFLGQEAGSFVLGLNFRGQTIGPNGAAISGMATLSLTHPDMFLGRLTPLVNYQVRVNPIWDVVVRRTVDGKLY